MERSGTGRMAGVVLISMLVGALAMPRIAQAVGSVVTIQGGGSTSKAGVTKANQLLGTETAAASLHVYRASLGGSACHTLAAAPAHRGIILSHLVLSVTSTAGPTNEVVLYRGAGCGPLTEWLRFAQGAGSTVDVSLGQGFAVKAGDAVSVQNGNIAGDITAFGYLVPAAAVPATTAVTTG